MFKTEFDFTLPKGYLDGEGNLHRQGTMRLAKAIDEIVPMRDPRVKSNPAYATVLILSRVITQLGALDEVSPRVIEEMYARDLNHLYDLYQEINGTANTAEKKPAAENESAEEQNLSESATEEMTEETTEEQQPSAAHLESNSEPTDQPTEQTSEQLTNAEPAYV